MIEYKQEQVREGQKAIWPYDSHYSVEKPTKNGYLLAWKYKNTTYYPPFTDASSSPFGPIDNDTNIYAVWEQVSLISRCGNTDVSYDGINNFEFTYYAKTENGKEIADNIDFEDITDINFVKIDFDTEPSSATTNVISTQNGQNNVKRVNILPNYEMYEKYYTFRVYTDNYGNRMYSNDITIVQRKSEYELEYNGETPVQESNNHEIVSPSIVPDDTGNSWVEKEIDHFGGDLYITAVSTRNGDYYDSLTLSGLSSWITLLTQRPTAQGNNVGAFKINISPFTTHSVYKVNNDFIQNDTRVSNIIYLTQNISNNSLKFKVKQICDLPHILISFGIYNHKNTNVDINNIQIELVVQNVTHTITFRNSNNSAIFTNIISNPSDDPNINQHFICSLYNYFDNATVTSIKYSEDGTTTSLFVVKDASNTVLSNFPLDENETYKLIIN